MPAHHGGSGELRSEPAAAEDSRQATGDVEFTTDGPSVNTTLGWREMKVGIFTKRDRAEAAAPEDWASRTLPPPTARIAFRSREERIVRTSLEDVAGLAGPGG